MKFLQPLEDFSSNFLETHYLGRKLLFDADLFLFICSPVNPILGAAEIPETQLLVRTQPGQLSRSAKMLIIAAMFPLPRYKVGRSRRPGCGRAGSAGRRRAGGLFIVGPRQRAIGLQRLQLLDHHFVNDAINRARELAVELLAVEPDVQDQRL